LALLVVAGIALFHVGVEHKWWEGSTACVGTSTAGATTEQLTEAILNAPLVRCDVPAWEMFGISMAGYNLLYALVLAALTFLGVRRSLKVAE
jgi:disulfide bond formation protein DsbB